MFWWREKVRHHNLYWFLLLFSSGKKHEEKVRRIFLNVWNSGLLFKRMSFCSGFSFSYVKPTFFQVIYFFHIWNGIFFRRKHFSSTKPNKWSFRRENFFFLCVRLKKCGFFRRKKRFRVHCYVSLCMLHMQWIAEPCFKLFPCTSLFVQKTVDMFFYHVKVVRKSQGKKDRSFFHVWNTWGKKSFCFKNGKIKKFSWKKIFFFTWFLIIMKENHLVEQISL